MGPGQVIHSHQAVRQNGRWPGGISDSLWQDFFDVDRKPLITWETGGEFRAPTQPTFKGPALKPGQIAEFEGRYYRILRYYPGRAYSFIVEYLPFFSENAVPILYIRSKLRGSSK